MKRIAFAGYLLILHGLLVYLGFHFLAPRYVRYSELPHVSSVTDPTAPHKAPDPVLDPPYVPREPEMPPDAGGPDVAAVPVVGPPNKLAIPVVGVKRSQLQDTYNDSRDDVRVHNAIDIMAPAGTPVIAAADGRLVRFHDSVPGGITIYQLSEDRRFIYYYAHLQRRADGLSEGSFVERGTVIGYVGDSGNAGPGNFHLHFSILVVADPERFWEGTNINPYPLLLEGIESSR